MEHCPECQANLPAGQTCQDHFHQMLFWETEDPANGEVHHLAVLCYHLQHPHLYSPAGLRQARHLLTEFVVHHQPPQQARRANRRRVDSGRREWKITARPGQAGGYARPVAWTLHAAEVVAGGIENYRANVRRWAEAVYADLQDSPD